MEKRYKISYLKGRIEVGDVVTDFQGYSGENRKYVGYPAMKVDKENKVTQVTDTYFRINGGPPIHYEYSPDPNRSIDVRADMQEVEKAKELEKELKERYYFNLSNNKPKQSYMTTLKEKFVLALTAEPKKSFRKAGVTDGDDILTDEGVKVFLTWLLHTVHAENFKNDVVNSILKEKEDEEN